MTTGWLPPAARRLTPLRRLARNIPRFLVVVDILFAVDREGTAVSSLRVLGHSFHVDHRTEKEEMMFVLNSTLALSVGATPLTEGAIGTMLDEQRRGEIGDVTWETPQECRDLLEVASVSASDLAKCPTPIHLTVAREEHGFVGRQHWAGADGPEVAANEPQLDCNDALATLGLQLQIHCQVPVGEPEPPPPPEEVMAVEPASKPLSPPPPPPEEVMAVEPASKPLSPPPCLANVELALLTGFGTDAQALGRGGSTDFGCDLGRWRASILVAREQFYHIGSRGDGIDGYAMRLPTFTHVGTRVCYEVMHGATNPGGALITMPACVTMAFGQIRGGRSGRHEWWSGVEGSLRLVVGSRGPVAFRAGADLVISLLDGVTRSGGFYEQGDLAVRLAAGMELRPRFLSRQHREAAREIRQTRAEQREQRRAERARSNRVRPGGVR